MDRNRHKTTKTLVGLAVVASGLAAPLATHDAEASYFTGAMCSVGTRGQHWAVASPAGSIQTTSGTTGLGLRCAMPVNQQGGALSSTPFSFRIWRSSGSGSTFCAGDVYDHNGNNIFQSSFVSATNTANTFQWLTPAAGPAAADTYNFSGQCTIATNDKLVATRLGPDRTTSNKAHNPMMNISGSICRPTSSANENDFKYDDSRIANMTNGFRDVICPVPADIDLGGHLEWTFTMDDETTTGGITCLGVHNRHERQRRVPDAGREQQRQRRRVHQRQRSRGGFRPQPQLAALRQLLDSPRAEPTVAVRNPLRSDVLRKG